MLAPVLFLSQFAGLAGSTIHPVCLCVDLLGHPAVPRLTAVSVLPAARDAESRDELQQEMIRSLQSQILELTTAVAGVLAEKETVTWKVGGGLHGGT